MSSDGARDLTTVETRRDTGRITLMFRGTLDGSTYRPVRDSVIEAALEGPDLVVVDVSGLEAAGDSAWTVFTSARWHVSTWPDVPIVLVCEDEGRRSRIADIAGIRHIPLYASAPPVPDIPASRHNVRRRAGAELPSDVDSLRRARRFVAQWLAAWDRSELVRAASTVATILVENVLTHTTSNLTLVVEAAHETVTVAISDKNPRPAARHEHPESGAHTVSGLAIVAALSRAWGSTPTADGKTVWALLGPENYL